MESFFVLVQSYTFLAPLSDPMFGSEMAPEPKREENHGIDRLFVLQLYTPGTPVGSDFWRPECSGAQTEGESWIRYVFVIKTLYMSGTPLGSDFWYRKSCGAHTGGK